MLSPVAEQVQAIGTPFRLRIERRTLRFKKPAQTSRGVLHERIVYEIHADAPCGEGVGACCAMPGLSPEEGTDYEARLRRACAMAEKQGGLLPGQLQNAPSIRFGLESALLAARRPGAPRWDTPFSRGETGIRLHWLIWMDTADKMLESMAKGVEKGFRCLKLKVGALPFDQETAMLREAHAAFPGVEIRVDANGAFSPSEARQKLETLANAGVSCIEQPIRPGQWADMKELCRCPPLCIALDEELIAAATPQAREKLIDTLRPGALVIKPSLHGGLSGAEHWAELADAYGIRWLANSALESHIGLTALAEWCALRAPDALHGLGTGLLFADDDPGPVILSSNMLIYNS